MERRMRARREDLGDVQGPYSRARIGRARERSGVCAENARCWVVWCVKGMVLNRQKHGRHESVVPSDRALMLINWSHLSCFPSPPPSPPLPPLSACRPLSDRSTFFYFNGQLGHEFEGGRPEAK